MKRTEGSTVLDDTVKTPAQLIGLLRVGSLISGECSLCHEVILSKVSQESVPASRPIKDAFAKHVGTKHF